MPYTNFRNYPNKFFVETGSYNGMGIRAALECGFETILSLEISSKYYMKCLKEFEKYPNVYIYYADSGTELYKIIKHIEYPITFWLDGHWSGEDTGIGIDKYPLLLELVQIKQHPIKTHTLIIDDVRLFNTEWKLGIDTIKKYILDINPDYKFHFEDGYQQNDVLVAQV